MNRHAVGCCTDVRFVEQDIKATLDQVERFSSSSVDVMTSFKWITSGLGPVLARGLGRRANVPVRSFLF